MVAVITESLPSTKLNRAHLGPGIPTGFGEEILFSQSVFLADFQKGKQKYPVAYFSGDHEDQSEH